MKSHNPELISALVDGELTGLRRWLVRRHLDRCPTCALEYRHLQHVRQMLAANPVRPVAPDSPEFFWSQVKRSIEQQAGQTCSVPVPRLRWNDWLGEHRYAMAAALATVVVVAGLWLTWRTDRLMRGTSEAVVVENVTTAIPDTVATPLPAENSDVTVIWVSGLPWTPDMKEMQTLFANLDT